MLPVVGVYVSSMLLNTALQPPLGQRRALFLSGMYGSEVVELIAAYREAGEGGMRQQHHYFQEHQRCKARHVTRQRTRRQGLRVAEDTLMRQQKTH
jgi:hypothetical protein